VRDRKLHFPLLADFEPNGAVARDYGVCLLYAAWLPSYLVS